MALPTTSVWDLVDYDESTLGGLLSASPSDVAVTPSVTPYFHYDTNFTTLYAESVDGVEAALSFNVPIPGRFTLELLVRFPAMPHNTGDLSRRKAGVSIADDASRGASIYFASTGLALSRIDDFGSVAVLPDTTDVTEEVSTSYKTIRIAVDSSLGRAYVFVGDGDTAYPQLRYIVPVAETPNTVIDRFRLFVQGTVAEPCRLEIKRVRLASDLVVSNFPPTADPGPDRVTSVGQAVRFDGRASFDVEGAALTYRWTATDAPYGSSFAAECGSGTTADDGDADGYTTLLSFASGALPSWVAANDILRVGGTKHVIAAVNNAGGTLTVNTDSIPDDLVATPFRVIRQSILVGADTETPYAIPDVQGIYRFELVVNDGESDSEPAEVLANIVGARAPFGIEPDVTPIWSALGDEWKLIENRGVFEEVWRGAAQILGSKLLEVWQYHYNYSIRDAQRTLQRKWVAFRTLLAETAPDEASISARYGALLGAYRFELGDPVVTGNTLVFEYFTGGTPTETATKTVVFTGDSLSTIVTDINAALGGLGITAYSYGVASDSPALRYEGDDGSTTSDGEGDDLTDTFSFTPGSLPAWVGSGDTLVVGGDRFTIAAVNNAVGTLTTTDDAIPDGYLSASFLIYRNARLGIKAPSRAFRLTASSTAAAALGLSTDTYNYLGGLNGALVTDRVYAVLDGIDLVEHGVVRGDLLVLNGGQSFRVDRVLTGAGDPVRGQRLLLSDSLPLDATPEWAIPSVITSAEVDYEKEGVYPGDLIKYEIHDAETDEVADARCVVVAEKGYAIAANLDGVFGALTDPDRYELRLLGVKRRKSIDIGEDIISIPRLQDKIPVVASPTIYKEHADYVLEPFYRDAGEAPIPMLQFRDSVFIGTDTEPPDVLWAEVVLYDNERNVENLFGRLAGFLRDDASLFGRDFNYVSGVAGLLYAQQRGSNVAAMRAGAQILFGQPFAEVDGVILEIRPDYSPSKGRVLVQDDDGFDPPRTDIVRSYFYTKDPLNASDTSGLAINPSTGSPWAEGDRIVQFSPIGGGVAIVDMYNDPEWYKPFVRAGVLNELQKFHTFTVTYNLDLVSLANLSLLFGFVAKVKPADANMILLGQRNEEDDIDIVDSVGGILHLRLLDSLSGTGKAYSYDDYRGDGTTWSSFDDGGTYYDGLVDCPEDYIEFELTMEWAGGAITYDSAFFYDTEVVDVDGTLGSPGSTFTPYYDMTLPAGTYQVTVVIKSGGVVLP